MKTITNRTLGFVFLFLAVFLFGYAGQAQTLSSLYTQEGNELLYVEEGASLKSALEKVEKHYKVRLLYRSNVVEGLTVKQAENLTYNVEESLLFLLKETNLRFKTLNPNTYGIYKNAKTIPQELDAVQQNVTGIVTDSQTGDPLPGVNIVIRGTSTGTTTDVDGEFELVVPALDEVLIFSYVGYETLEVPLDDQNELIITLQQVQVEGDELVVVGYGLIDRRDMTGSISELNASRIAEVPTIQADEALRGRMAGVQVTQNSGAPGSRIQVRIRGNNSVLASNQPLYVVNGVPISSGIDHLNPTDIESMNVLKDASATAIYGSRGANGVVLIETKKGSNADEHNIDISSYVGFQKVRKRYDVMNAQQFGEMANRLEENRGASSVPFPNPSSLQDVTDWQDEIFRTAPMQNHSISVSGGSENNSYYVSGNFLEQEGIVIGSNQQKGGLNLNLEQGVGENLRISTNIGITRQELNQIQNDNLTRGTGVTAAAFASPPTLAPTDDEGDFTNVAIYGFSPNVLRNPVMLAEVLQQSLQTKVVGSTEATIMFNDHFDLSILGSTDQSFNEFNFYSPTFNPFTSAGSASTTNSKSISYLAEVRGNYVQTLRRNDRLSLTAGFIWEDFTSKFNNQSGSGFATDAFLNRNLGAAETTNPNNTSITEWRLLSSIARANYSLNDRFIFTFTARADGSSRFGENHKWGFFPSGAFSWRLAQEDFISNLNTFDELKLRVSYGRSGNTAISPYQSLNRLTTSRAVFDGGDAIGFIPAAIANPDLKWETTDQLNIGLDMAFLENKIRITVDGYNKSTKDLLANIPIAPSTGFGSVPTNLGEVQNKGVELSIGADIFSGSTFSWIVEGQFSANRNEVIDIGGRDVFGPTIQQPFANPVNIAREGEPIGMLWGYEEDGLDENGFIKYKDLDGDGIEDRTIIGNPYPDFIYGLQQDFFYKNISLNVFIEGVYGNDIFWGTAGHLANSFNRGENQFVDVYENHWRSESPNPNAKYPRVDPSVSFNASDRYIEDGSYLRLKNIRLSYDIPVASLGLTGFRNIQLYVSGQNLVTITDYPGLEPEINTRGSEGDLRIGIDEMGYPSAKVYTFGINIGL